MLSGPPQVPQEVAVQLCARPSADEGKAGLSSRKRGSTPGPDVLPVEFYLPSGKTVVLFSLTLLQMGKHYMAHEA